MSAQPRLFARRFFAGIALLGLLCLAGCGASTVPVTGKVTYKGKPLDHGSVTFFAGGGTYASAIAQDGTYNVTVPVGKAKVIVSCTDEKAQLAYTQALQAQSRGGGGGNAGPKAGRAGGKEEATGNGLPPMPKSGSFELIPPKYADMNSSDLQADVTSSTKTIDLTLTD